MVEFISGISFDDIAVSLFATALLRQLYFGFKNRMIGAKIRETQDH